MANTPLDSTRAHPYLQERELNCDRFDITEERVMSGECYSMGVNDKEWLEREKGSSFIMCTSFINI